MEVNSTQPQPPALGARQKIWSIGAWPLDESAVLVSMGTKGEVREGPWSFVTDIPSPGREMLGPPPIYLALAGWAT